MNKLIKIKVVLLGLIALVIMPSCVKDSENEFIVFADAYVLKRMVNQEPVYANSYVVYANQELVSANVTLATGNTVQLHSVGENAYAMSYEPGENDFKPSPPLVDDYSFEITSARGELAKQLDFLEFQDLAVPNITKAIYNKTKQNLEIEWSPVPSVDGYVVKIANSAKETIYLGYSLTSEATTFYVNKTEGNWYDEVFFGKEYTLEVHAFAYETNAAADDIIYNVREISIGEVGIFWGE